MKTPYDAAYHPPAPVLSVSLAMPREAPGVEAQLALVDSGADGTFVPTGLIQALNVPPSYMTNVRSHLGEKRLRVPVYNVDIILSDATRLPDVDVVGDDLGDCIILGRNVLNKLRLCLDGPARLTEIFT